MGFGQIDSALRAARLGVFGVFGLNGFVVAMWVVHIPAITERTGVSKATLGLLILLLAAGAIVGMRLAGPLADRYGTRLLVAGSVAIVAASLVGPGLATNALGLGIALFVFGFGNGALDVSMNSEAVHVERGYGRPIMSAFHAFFSCGGLAGALFGAATLQAGWDLRVALIVAGVMAIGVAAVCVPRLLPRVEHEAEAAAPRGHTSWRVWALGAVAFGVMLAEGVANDWSALQVTEHLGVTEAAGALAFAAFSTTMTVGRFVADRIAGAYGPVAMVRYGSLVAAVGMTTVVFSDSFPLTLAGWALSGAGLAGTLPQVFTAAGNLSAGSTGANLSRVVGLGYVAFLAGPSVIGGLTKVVSLTTAMVVPLVAVLVAAAAARVVAPRQPTTAR